MKKKSPTKNKIKTYKRNYNLICKFCSKEFKGLRPGDKFCSSYCRYANTFKNYTEAQKLRRQKYQKKWGEKNWQSKRNYMLKYTYGITPEQYDELLIKQNYSCAICKKHEKEFARKLAVEHNHKTGEIWGLCCDFCNRHIIGKHRNADILFNASEYLKKPGTGWIVPPKKKRRRRRK